MAGAPRAPGCVPRPCGRAPVRALFTPADAATYLEDAWVGPLHWVQRAGGTPAVPIPAGGGPVREAQRCLPDCVPALGVRGVVRILGHPDREWPEIAQVGTSSRPSGHHTEALIPSLATSLGERRIPAADRARLPCGPGFFLPAAASAARLSRGVPCRARDAERPAGAHSGERPGSTKLHRGPSRAPPSWQHGPVRAGFLAVGRSARPPPGRAAQAALPRRRRDGRVRRAEPDRPPGGTGPAAGGVRSRLPAPASRRRHRHPRSPAGRPLLSTACGGGDAVVGGVEQYRRRAP